MRRRLSYLAAGIGAFGAVSPFRLSPDDTSLGDDFGTFVVVVLVLTLVPTALSVAFAHGRVSQGWTVAGIVLFVAAAGTAGALSFYVQYLAGLALGLAIAAGEPLPEHDSDGDYRAHAPMPRRD